ncbi:dCTP deaminase [Haloarchaeobius sp. HME9146]|uniref:dCTP deaminase n=1 Tax=Haloarchaeobius sp. HME9146 TaxID=2978732 RepID=UPI0021C0A8AD|nr:dCTP deaminase [Haloarchaeobius sp. HME9146]MCT9096318.1 dCTP deaminase [Haloarchaeobius sp. HME9146]
MPQDIVERVDGLVHPETQVRDHGIDLTVSAIHEVVGPGRIDFGEDELQEAEFEPHELTTRNPGDEYQWWELDAGQYVVQYNEFMVGEGAARLLLQPRNKLMARGASHPTVTVGDHLPLMPLSVGGAGLNVKENARISTLVPVHAGPDAVDDGPLDSETTVVED